MDGLGLLIVALATYRLAHIVTRETITRPLRDRVVGGEQPPEDGVPRSRRQWAAYFVHCFFCVSVWAGWLTVAAWWWAGWPGRLLVLGLAASAGAMTLDSALAALHNGPGGRPVPPGGRQG